MTDLFNQETKPLTGGLRQFKVLSSSDELDTGGTMDSPWSEAWSHRGGFPFRMNTGKTTELVFLTDVKPLIVHEVAFGEKAGPSGRFPLKEYVRSMTLTGVDEEGNFVHNDTPKCLFEAALGRKPKFIYLAKILDMTEYTDKKNVTHKWTVRHVLIDNQTVISQLAAVGEVHGRDMQYARFKVSRSMQQKSPRVGDSWTLMGYLDPTEHLDGIPGMRAAEEKIDLDKGFPMFSEEAAKQILGQHRKVASAFPGDTSRLLRYSEAGMDEILGTTSVGDVIKDGPSIAELEPDAVNPSNDDKPEPDPFNEMMDDFPLPGSELPV